MDFIHWWFDTHWIWASILTTGPTFLYALFTEQTAWAWALAACWWVGPVLKALRE